MVSMSWTKEVGDVGLSLKVCVHLNCPKTISCLWDLKSKCSGLIMTVDLVRYIVSWRQVISCGHLWLVKGKDVTVKLKDSNKHRLSDMFKQAPTASARPQQTLKSLSTILNTSKGDPPSSSSSYFTLLWNHYRCVVVGKLGSDECLRPFLDELTCLSPRCCFSLNTVQHLPCHFILQSVIFYLAVDVSGTTEYLSWQLQ